MLGTVTSAGLISNTVTPVQEAQAIVYLDLTGSRHVWRSRDACVGGELLTCIGSLPPSLRLVTLFMKSKPRTVTALGVCMVVATVVIPRKTGLVALVCSVAKAMKVVAVSALGLQHQQNNEDTPGLLPSNNTMSSGPRGNQQSWRHLDEVGRSASHAPDNKPEQRDERKYLE
jgi:hypothetical protein